MLVEKLYQLVKDKLLFLTKKLSIFTYVFFEVNRPQAKVTLCKIYLMQSTYFEFTLSIVAI
jgi:hypothetical protein